MSIRLICVCGRGMVLPDKYAGEYVQCPDCRAMLCIPTPEEDLTLIRWICRMRPASQGPALHRRAEGELSEMRFRGLDPLLG